MNKLTEVQKRWIVVGIGVLIILIGVIQGLFKPAILINHQQAVNDITFILMVFAAMLLFSNKRRKPQADQEGQNQNAVLDKPEEAGMNDETKEPK